MIIWCLDNYEDINPITLSVGEEDEISIRDAAEMVRQAMRYERPLEVLFPFFDQLRIFLRVLYSLTLRNLMANSKKLPATKNCVVFIQILNLLHLKKVHLVFLLFTFNLLFFFLKLFNKRLIGFLKIMKKEQLENER